MNVEDGAETALVEMFQKAHVTAARDPRFCAIQEGGQHDSSVNIDFRVRSEVVVVVPDTFDNLLKVLCALDRLLSTYLSGFAFEEIVHQVAELVDCFQLCLLDSA